MAHAAVAFVALILCTVVLAWVEGRAGVERRRLEQQHAVLTTSLVNLSTQIVRDHVLGNDNAGTVHLSPQCSLCVQEASNPRVHDLTPWLATIVRTAGPGALAALVEHDGALQGIRPDGSVFAGHLAPASVARLGTRHRMLLTLELDGVEQAAAAAPIGPDMFLLLGTDLGARLETVERYRWQDRFWALATCLLLLLLAATLSIGLERSARRRRDMSRNGAALSLLNAELKAAHDRLRLQKDDLEATFAAMSDGVSYYDRDFRLVYWNHPVPALTGVPPGVMRPGVPMEDVLRSQLQAGEFGTFANAEAVEADISARKTVLQRHTPLRVTERTRPNGRTIELRRTSLADGGFVTIYTDVTSRKQAAAAQEEARLAAERTAEDKARFAAIVSHEVRTPLHVILNSLGLVDRCALPPGQRTLVDTGIQAGEALLTLLNDILDLSRLEGGNLPVVAAPFAPVPLLAGVADMFRDLARRRGVDFVLSVAPGVPAHVVADSRRVRQILVNLVSNAAKFAAPGPVTLAVATVPALPGTGPVLRFAVRDAGPVIPANQRALLFRPFSRLERTAGDGSGLGLAICALLAERMGGKAAVEEVVHPGGKPGNEFSVSLPLRIPGAPANRNSSVPDLARHRRLPRTRILVVEDVDASRWLLATALRRDGHHVCTAANAAEALACVARTPFDLLLMDVMMPGMDGCAATRRLRSLPGPAGRLAVLGLTASTDKSEHDTCRAAGMDEVLSKPASLPQLRDAIARHVWLPAAGLRPPGRGGSAEEVPAQDSPAWDPSRLQDVPGTSALLRDCLQDLTVRQSVLEDAAAAADHARLATTAHAMAGAAANYGFVALSHTLVRLTEDTADLATTDMLVVRAAADLRRARAHVDAVSDQENGGRDRD